MLQTEKADPCADTGRISVLYLNMIENRKGIEHTKHTVLPITQSSVHICTNP